MNTKPCENVILPHAPNSNYLFKGKSTILTKTGVLIKLNNLAVNPVHFGSY